MAEEILNSLNQILKGEHMAIDIYATYISKMDNTSLKKELQGILLDHKRHALLLSDRIQELGGFPDESRGIEEAMAETGARLKTLFRLDTNQLLKQVYDGEDQGIARVEEIRKRLDVDSRLLVEQMLSEDHDHLKRLEQLIAMSGQTVH